VLTENGIDIHMVQLGLLRHFDLSTKVLPSCACGVEYCRKNLLTNSPNEVIVAFAENNTISNHNIDNRGKLACERWKMLERDREWDALIEDVASFYSKPSTRPFWATTDSAKMSALEEDFEPFFSVGSTFSNLRINVLGNKPRTTEPLLVRSRENTDDLWKIDQGKALHVLSASSGNNN
jgi:hypothetical protein